MAEPATKLPVTKDKPATAPVRDEGWAPFDTLRKDADKADASFSKDVLTVKRLKTAEAKSAARKMEVEAA